MSSISEHSSDVTINLPSLGEKLLTSYIEKGRDSILTKYKKQELQDHIENAEFDYPAFFDMLNTDPCECNEEWILKFNQAISNSSEDDIKKYARPTIEILTSVVHFLLTDKNCKKKSDQIGDKKTESNSDSCTLHYSLNDYDNDEILKELTSGLDPKFVDSDFDIARTADAQTEQLDEYELSEKGKKLYKTHQDIY